MYTSGSYVWHTRAIEVFGSANNSTLRLSADAHTFNVRAGKTGDDKIVEDPVSPVDEALDGKKVSVISLDPQNYNR